MRILKQTVALAAALALAMAPATAAAASTPKASTSASQNTLRLPMDGSEVDSLNPFEALFQASLDILNLEYESLVAETPPSSATGPSLAKSWKVHGDDWTFTLRPNMKWSDGTPLTAEDVAWTYNQVMSKPSLAVANGSVVAQLASVTAEGTSTVKIVTKQPTAVNPGVLPIVPKHIWSKLSNPSKYANTANVVGNGPFVLKKYSTGVSAAMTANPYYWGGKPSLDGVLFINYKNNDAAVLALKSGEIDIDSGMDPAQFNSLKGTKGITTKVVPSEHFWDLSVNPGTTMLNGKAIGNGAAVLHDPVVRNAIRRALDTKELVQKIVGGYGSTGPEIIPPAYPTYYSNYPNVAKGYSVAAANKMLDDAGYKMGPNGYRLDKSGKPIDLRLSYNASDSGNTETASFIQPWLKAIGIQVTLDPTNWDVMDQNVSDGNYDMYINGWGVSADPDYMLYINTCATRPTSASGANNATEDNWCDPAYDKLYQAQHAENNQAERVKLVHEALTVHYKAAVCDILYYDDALEAYRSDRLSGLIPMSGDIDNVWSLAHAKLATSSSSGNATGWVIGIVIVLILAAGATALIVVRRRRTAEERE